MLLVDVKAQELFPFAEPASTVPKGVVGLRLMYESFREYPSQRVRYWNAARLMYGVTGKFTVMLTGTMSNHHQKKFPVDLQNYFINHHQITYPQNPYTLEGSNLYLKYRVISIDQYQKHLRVTLIGQAAKSFIPHDEAEPWLMGDNSGVGGGIIGTFLYKKFAVSMTAERIIPFAYVDKRQNIKFQSGKGWDYIASAGFRLFPLRYKTYKDINVNLYFEVLNKVYEGAAMEVKGIPFDFEFYKNFDLNIYNGLIGNTYSEMRPSIQFIFNSNTRLDFGVAQPLRSRSYLHFYPMYFINLQKYFFKKNIKNT